MLAIIALNIHAALTLAVSFFILAAIVAPLAFVAAWAYSVILDHADMRAENKERAEQIAHAEAEAEAKALLADWLAAKDEHREVQTLLAAIPQYFVRPQINIDADIEALLAEIESKENQEISTTASTAVVVLEAAKAPKKKSTAKTPIPNPKVSKAVEKTISKTSKAVAKAVKRIKAKADEAEQLALSLVAV